MKSLKNFMLIMIILNNIALSEKKLHPLFSRDEMGNLIWMVMHLYSSFFPENPTHTDAKEYQRMILYLGKHFPCKECSSHFLEMVKDNPINFTTREGMMKYICKIHNIVNKRLNKQMFNCDEIDKIWGQKDCGCSVKSLKQELGVKGVKN